ncbi:GNAT family N-acetyltransferase [Undibacterium sp.]|uniref:GNAT family N-acetyltransferase n=1 Tax=Undibacterium sp. TaxID=1914977 RepID=UPI0025D41FA0|nr:GNAT family N-acetyltransferase [Undibacterium sp.]MCX7221322.1 GNAT family N-acetyltransferase [Burkholderiales bacterium]
MSTSLPTLTIHPPTLSDLDDLYAFEMRNRLYFEHWINARPADYYSLEGVALAIQSAQQDAAKDSAYQYLVRENGLLLARVNLTQVKRPHHRQASLGYRVAQEHNGRGVAKAAVRLALQQAFTELDLWRIEACARPENLASVKVLLANDFAQFGHSKRCFQLGATWYDLLHFEVHAEK